jgi:endonuclease/exonuclease/phosphatase family metal-dependent hydrolase
MEEITPLTAVSPRPLMTASLRLCTWNIEFGLQLDAIVSAVKSCADFSGIDMLALQEASIHDGVEDGRVIAQALGSQYEYYQMAAQRVNGRVQANALIWNVDCVRVETRSSVKLPQRHEVKLSHAERLFLRAIPLQQRISIVVEARVAADLQSSGPFGERPAVTPPTPKDETAAPARHSGTAPKRGRLEDAGREAADKLLRIYVAHLDVMGYELKRRQFHYILEDAHKRPAADLSVIAGDLNTFRLFRARPSWQQLEDTANAVGFRDITTEIRWTRSVASGRLKQKLDAIFIRQPLSVPYRSWSLEIPGSDHIPVFAELQLE